MKQAAVALAAVCFAFTVLDAAASEPDPPVPPDRDGGGIAVSVIGSGLDYTSKAVAARLARDGEGEIIGYDYIGDDRRPFTRDNRAGQDMVEIVLGEGQTTRLVVVRAETGTMISLSRALLYAGKSPAPLILIEALPHERDCIAALASAIRHFYDRLFIIAAGDEGRDLDQGWAAGLRGLPNLLVVAASGADGALVSGANSGALTITIATAGAPLKGDDFRPEGAPGPSMRAAAHIAALAARLRAAEPAIPAAALKQRISDLAKPGSAATAKTVLGIIERPEGYNWAE